jgi:hypothetical protein
MATFTGKSVTECRSNYYSTVTHCISKPGCYYIRFYLLSLIIRIKTLLKHVKTLLYQLLHSEFLDYYIILYHTAEISYYIT